MPDVAEAADPDHGRIGIGVQATRGEKTQAVACSEVAGRDGFDKRFHVAIH